MKDEIFTQPLQKQFEFNASVASVFDDMASRSIPFYNAVCKLVCDFLSLELNTGARVADLGCSTATTLLALWQKRQNLRLKGFDNSAQMLEIAAKKCEAYGAKIEFECSDILEADFEADSVILNYSLQFIRPPKRAKFVEKIFNSLSVGGSLVLSEKLAFTNAKFAKEMITITKTTKSCKATRKRRSPLNAPRWKMCLCRLVCKKIKRCFLRRDLSALSCFFAGRILLH